MKFRATKTSIDGLLVLEPTVFGDERGYLFESYNERDLTELGIRVRFVQDNQSRSARGTLRGLHFQRTKPQAKLIRVIRGSVFDVAADLRQGSPTFARWHGVVLDEETKKQLFIPAGFAHGFLSLSEPAEVFYKCSDFFDADDEGGLLWNDPDVGIEWPLGDIAEPILSAKDRVLSCLGDLEPLGVSADSL